MPASADRQAAPGAGDDLDLVRRALAGERAARAEVTRIADPLINAQTERFCKRFCRNNRFEFACTLARPWGSPRSGAVLCEWGNASYAWMLDDLTGGERLARYQGRDAATLADYLFHIVNSLPFYERWKNWRFARRVHVPTYIQALAPEAARVFLALRAGDSVPLIAQALGAAETTVDELAQAIVLELTRRRRLHLLDPPRTYSLTGAGADDDPEAAGPREADIAVEDEPPERQEVLARLRAAWAELDPGEQFVLEAMLVEDREANDVLAGLRALDIAIADGVPAAQTNRQQLYYFRRKSLARLARLLGEA